MRIVIASMFAVMLAGCAAEPRSTPIQAAETGRVDAAPAAAVASAVPAAAAPATTAPEAAAPAAPATDTAGAAVADAAKFVPPSGYKKQVKDGRDVYCRKMVILGSRFPQMMCFSEAELRDMEARNDTMRRDKDQTSRLCDISCKID